MDKVRSVRGRTSVSHSRMSQGFDTYGLRGIPGTAIDPFLNVDDFRMSEPTFPPHPHAGFSAVTYMFEDSKGSFVNRDSLGDRSVIGPGAFHWTQAARGMMHEEVPQLPGIECHGLQIFVNLRSDHKHEPPRAFHLEAADIPVVALGNGSRARVLAGRVMGTSSPMTGLLTPVLLLDVRIAAGDRIRIPVERDWNCFVMSISGAGETGPEAARQSLQAHEALGFGVDGDAVELVAGAAGLQILLGAGQPIGEPVVFGGPFAMTNANDIAAAQQRYRRGEMGRLV